MLNRNPDHESALRPSGFTTHSGGLASEYAREQGWGINEEERTRTASAKQDYEGGRDYDYGAGDFSSSAVDTRPAPTVPARVKSKETRQRKSPESSTS